MSLMQICLRSIHTSSLDWAAIEQKLLGDYAALLGGLQSPTEQSGMRKYKRKFRLLQCLLCTILKCTLETDLKFTQCETKRSQ